MQTEERSDLPACEFQSIKSCSNNLFIVGSKIHPLGDHLKYGVIDNRGRYVIPMDYISIHEEIGKYFRVRRLSDDKTAMLDLKGEIIVDFGEYNFLWPFWGRYIKVGKKVEKNRQYGLLDTDLHQALPCVYSDIFACLAPPHEGSYGIRMEKNDPWEFVSSAQF